jgi:hypothetical protein
MADKIQPGTERVMNAMARGIDAALNGEIDPDNPPKYGFILLVAEFGKIDNGRVNYISNGQRSDMLAMMREYLARAEGRYAEPTKGNVQ